MGNIRNSWGKSRAPAIECYLVKKSITALGNIGLFFKAKRIEVNIFIFIVFMQVLPLE